MVDTWLRLGDYSIPRRYASVAEAIEFPATLEFSGNVSLRPLYCAEVYAFTPGQGNVSEGFILPAFTTQQSVVADTLINTATTWVNALINTESLGHGVSPNDEQTAVHTIKQDYYQPYSAANCIRDSITAQNGADPISVPIIAPVEYNPVPSYLQNLTHALDGIPVIDYPQLKRAQLLEANGSGSDYRTTFFELPSSFFNLSGLGVAILLPSLYSDTTDEIQMVVCNLHAGWGLSSINTTYTSLGLSATSSLIDVTFSRPSAPNSLLEQEGNALESVYKGSIDVGLGYLLPEYPQIQIDIRKDWAEYLNPLIPDLNTSIIDYMMKTSSSNGTIHHPELLAGYILGALLTNGLARVGADYQFQGDPRVIQASDGTPELDGTFWLTGKGDFFTVDEGEAESKNWTKLRVDSTIQGYAYNTRGTGPKTAMAFLLTYCALALAYTVYMVISGTSALLPHSATTVDRLLSHVRVSDSSTPSLKFAVPYKPVTNNAL